MIHQSNEEEYSRRAIQRSNPGERSRTRRLLRKINPGRPGEVRRLESRIRGYFKRGYFFLQKNAYPVIPCLGWTMSRKTEIVSDVFVCCESQYPFVLSDHLCSRDLGIKMGSHVRSEFRGRWKHCGWMECLSQSGIVFPIRGSLTLLASIRYCFPQSH